MQKTVAIAQKVSDQFFNFLNVALQRSRGLQIALETDGSKPSTKSAIRIAEG